MCVVCGVGHVGSDRPVECGVWCVVWGMLGLTALWCVVCGVGHVGSDRPVVCGVWCGACWV